MAPFIHVPPSRLAVLAFVCLGAITLLPFHCNAQRPGPDRDRGPGGSPPMEVQAELELVPKFDKDGDKRLNAAERVAAREFLAKEVAEGRGPRQTISLKSFVEQRQAFLLAHQTTLK